MDGLRGKGWPLLRCSPYQLVGVVLTPHLRRCAIDFHKAHVASSLDARVLSELLA